MLKKIFLVDVSSLYFRAFYAIRSLNNSRGLPTNALYGFISMTIKMLKEMNPDYIVYCFDRKEPSFRIQIDPNYKANRTEMPSDLQLQMPYVPLIVEALGIPALSAEGYEADDVIGTVAQYATSQGMRVIIVSGDKDFGQLVSDKIEIFDPMKDVIYNEVGVLDKMGVHPKQVVDYLALVGDTSDNIPGVTGIGPKGAQKLLQKYETLEKLYEFIEDVTPEGLRKKLLEGKESAFLSQKLSRIEVKVPLELRLEDMKLRPLLREKLSALLKELEFKQFEKTLLGEFLPDPPKEPQSPIAEAPSGQDRIKEEVGAKKFNGEADQGPIEEVRVTAEELKSLIPKGAEVWGIHTTRGFAIGLGDKCYILSDSAEKFGRVLSGLELRWRGHDIKEFWKSLSVTNSNCIWDHRLAAYVIRSQAMGGFVETYQKFLAPLPELPSFSQLYAAHRLLARVLDEQLEKQNGKKVYEELELPLVRLLCEMENYGVLIDSKELTNQSLNLSVEMQNLEKEIFETIGENFNLSSPKQLAHILFDKMKIPPVRKTKTGYSTDSDVLEKLSIDYPICLKIIDHREIVKLKNTYLESLPQMTQATSGRVHTTFNQAMAATGRLSSTNPNLQNIPIRTPRGGLVRKAFIAAPGSMIVSADYSQIELRILAHITNDKSLVQAFEEDLDIHALTAAEVFGKDIKEINFDLRRIAKAINFGIAYGMGAFGLSENLKISRSEAADIIKRYFVRFPGVQDYMVSIVETAKKQGYVETLYGRRRYIEELKSKNANLRQFGERAAINAPIQGTASDIVKKAMIDVTSRIHGHMILQVHDELIFEIPNEFVLSDSDQIVKVMESAFQLRVPLKVSIGAGANWFDAH